MKSKKVSNGKANYEAEKPRDHGEHERLEKDRIGH